METNWSGAAGTLWLKASGRLPAIAASALSRSAMALSKRVVSASSVTFSPSLSLADSADRSAPSVDAAAREVGPFALDQAGRGQGGDQPAGLVQRHGCGIAALAGQGVEGVDDGEETRQFGNVLSF